MATVPVSRTWVAGEIVTAAHFNTNIRDVLNWLLAPAICQASMASAQSIANITWVPLNFDTEAIDSTGMHSIVSNTDRFTAVYPGWYQASGSYGPASSAVGSRGTRFAVNGTPLEASQILLTAVALGGYPTRTMLAYLNVGDIGRMEVFQNTGGALGLLTANANERCGCTWTWVSN